MSQLIIGCVCIALAAVLGFYGQQKAREGWTKVFSADVRQVGPLPKPKGDRLAVLVGNFFNDQNDQLKHALIAALSEVTALETLPLDRDILVEPTTSTTAVQAGHAMARGILAETHANIVIWGAVLRVSGREVPYAFWTLAHAQEKIPQARRYPITADDLSFPHLFEKDLVTVVKFAALQHLQANDHPGAVSPEKFVNLFETVSVLAQQLPADTPIDTRAYLILSLAMAAQRLGESNTSPARLQQAVSLYQQAMPDLKLLQPADDWAVAQNNLGATLNILGDRFGEPEYQLRALEAYGAARTVFTSEKYPEKFAALSTNIGNVWAALERIDSDAGKLDLAEKAFRDALACYRRLNLPEHCSVVLNNLANACVSKGLALKHTDPIREGIGLHEEALKLRIELKRELDQALTKRNLGNAYRALGMIEPTDKVWDTSIKMYREALQIFSANSQRLDWARTQFDLGSAYLLIGSRKNDAASLLAAKSAYEEAMTVFKEDTSSADYSTTMQNLSFLKRKLGY